MTVRCVDHPAPTPDTLVRPWRTVALIACGIAAVELVLVIGLASSLFGRPFINRATASPSATRVGRSAQGAATSEAAGRAVTPSARLTWEKPPGPPRLSRRQTSVLVLNGNGLTGAAAAQAQRVRARGYVVAAVGNAPRSDYARSLVMYRPGFEAEARRLARDVGIGIVSPLDGLRVRGLRGAHVAVIVGR